MERSARRERERQARLDAIVEAAERLFFSKGYETATMDDVAHEAQFSKRTVYLYCSGKEELYFEVMARGYRRLLGMLRAEREKEAPPDALARLRQIFLTLYRFGQAWPGHFRAIMEYENGEKDFEKSVPAASREACYALGEQLMGELVETVRQGMAEGVFRTELDAVQAALVLWACAVGVFGVAFRKKNYLEHYYKTEPQAFVEAAFRLMTDSLRCGEKEDGR